jgi:antitoxin VapB
MPRIHIDVYTERAMAVAKVFKSGNSQAVRLPKEFRVNADEVEIFRRGDELVLREKPRNLVRAFELLCQLPDDLLDGVDDPPPQEREGL